MAHNTATPISEKKQHFQEISLTIQKTIDKAMICNDSLQDLNGEIIF